MSKLAVIAMVVVCLAGEAQANPQFVDLSMTTSGANWYLWLRAPSTCNGLASFQIDLAGTGNTQILSSTLMAPAYNAIGTFANTGFQMFQSNGVVSAGRVTGIQAGQATAYGDVNVTDNDAKVIQGIGQIGNAVPAGYQGVTWGVPVLLAQGTFSGPGTFTASNFACNVLSKVNGGAWVGPGNVEPAGWFPAEPGTMSLLVLGSLALLRRRHGYAG